ncbi:hypothetical protein MUK42_00304 [Musa troglodytarum]|uniref:Uncharacterized protein n=1 Tax=Musa troglodytarum TaxID=320322 RepID=A0A9E7GCK6_9LILI|nr:hypothetical protein MUK42_00304 [Musa troglodytarum]
MGSLQSVSYAPQLEREWTCPQACGNLKDEHVEKLACAKLQVAGDGCKRCMIELIGYLRTIRDASSLCHLVDSPILLPLRNIELLQVLENLGMGGIRVT